jgi:hypothetical protein
LYECVCPNFVDILSKNNATDVIEEDAISVSYSALKKPENYAFDFLSNT